MTSEETPMSDTGLNFRIEIKPKTVRRSNADPHRYPHDDFICLEGFAWEVIVTGSLSCTFTGGAESLTQAGEACAEAIAQAKALLREVEKP